MVKCKLCLDNEADCKGSHIVPHFLLKRIFNVEGKTGRDSELEFVIDAFNTKAYYGRRVPIDKLESLFDNIIEGESDENRDPHVEDNIFCTTCEKKLSEIESLYAKTLSKDSTEDYDSGIIAEYGLLFWASVLWRMSINKKNGVIQSKGEDETLRRILNRYLKEKIGDIDVENMRHAKDLKKISYKLLRCPGYSAGNPTFLFMYPVILNPYTLLIDEFILFFSHNSNYNDYKVRSFYGVKEHVIDAPLNNRNENEKIGVIPKEMMIGVSEGIKKEFSKIRGNVYVQYLDLIHTELGGKGQMPKELKKEVFAALADNDVKEGVKFTDQHFKVIVASVLGKYEHLYH